MADAALAAVTQDRPTSAQGSGFNDPYSDKDPETDGQIVEFVENKYQKYNYYTHSLHRQWYEQILWYSGEHYLEFNYASGRFTSKRSAQHIPRTITNLIYPKVEVGIQLFMEAFPEAIVKPASREPKDRQSAVVANHVRKHLWRENHMQSKMRDIAAWTTICGNAFAINYLDKANKETVRIPRMNRQEEPLMDPTSGAQMPVMDEGGAPIPSPETGAPLGQTETKQSPIRNPETGDVEYEEIVLPDVNTLVVPPFEIIPDFAARHPWEYERYLHFRSFSLDFIKSQFGEEKGGKVKPEIGIGLNSYYQFKVLDLIARSQGSGYLGSPNSLVSGDTGEWLFMENSAILKTYFEKPSDRRPKGRIYAIANGVVLLNVTYSDLYGEDINLHHFRWSVLPGSIYGFGMVKQLIDPQKRLNGLDTQRALLRKTMGNPGWLVPVGCGFKEGLGTSEPGHIYTHKRVAGNLVPKRLDGKSPPADWEIERQNILHDMQEIAGIRHVLTGENPPGVTAGVSLDILTEAAGKRFQPMVAENRDMMRRLEMARLKMAQKAPAWSIPRLLMVIGEDKELDAKRFSAADFNGQFDIEIEAVTPSLFGSSQKKQDWTTLAEMGLINLEIPFNRELFRKQFSGSEFIDEYSDDMKVALYENDLFMSGRSVEIGMFDDHQIHIQQHERIFKRTDLEYLGAEVITPALEHLLNHYREFEEQMKEQAKQMAAQGMAPGQEQPQPAAQGAPS